MEVTGTIDATDAIGDSVRGPFTATKCQVTGFDPCSMLTTATQGAAWAPLTCASPTCT
jgi:hypothetical protein